VDAFHDGYLVSYVAGEGEKLPRPSFFLTIVYINHTNISLVDRFVSGTGIHIYCLHPPKNIGALERDDWPSGSLSTYMAHAFFLLIVSLYDILHSCGANLNLEIAFAPNHFFMAFME
jgi:hypothetical protein